MPSVLTLPKHLATVCRNLYKVTMSLFDPGRQPIIANPGVLVGAGFGTIFVLGNSGAPMPPSTGAALKVACVVAALTVLLATALRRSHPQRFGTDQNPFGRAFRLVLAAEVLVGVAGLLSLRLAGAPDQANVAWTALVVGGHFLALAVVWQDIGIAVVGAVMATVGLTGLTLVA